VVGTGATLKATTCHEDTDFDTIINVYTGDCGALVCVEGNDNSCDSLVGSSASTVSWPSQTGAVYFVVVSGSLAEDGTFKLTVEEM